MASLYKKKDKTTDPTTGKTVTTKSKKWWGKYRDVSGKIRREPLAADKGVAQTMLNDKVRRAEREKAGLIDPTDEQRKRPLAQHLTEFKRYLQNKNVTPKQVQTAIAQIQRIVDANKWKFIGDISASGTLEFLGELRRSGKSVQTYNHYLKSIKQFTRWLVRDRRSPVDALAHLSKLNVSTDRRHDRRVLTIEEFGWLIQTAHHGPPIESISGPDREMTYLLAGWTGFRKGEIGSLTPRSLRLDDDPPTATVAACYSKRRRQDTQILHPEVVRRLKAWLVTKPELKPDDPLFPVSGRVPGGKERKTHKMMRRDLEAAREAWIKEANIPEEQVARERSDFLQYQDDSGLFADFHSNRHMFITSLERAGVRPKMAQTLARHSDIRLTLGTYTHVDVYDQAAAIASLPSPPTGGKRPGTEAAELRATGTDGRSEERPPVPSAVPSGAQIGAQHPASKQLQIASVCTDEACSPTQNGDQGKRRKALRSKRFRTSSQRSASARTAPDARE